MDSPSANSSDNKKPDDDDIFNVEIYGMTQQDFQEDYQRWKDKLRVIENVWDLEVFEQRAQVDIDSMKQRIKRHKDWLLEDMKFYQVFLDKNRVNLKEIEKVRRELIEILR